ncbi:MAG: hypothetical protein PHH60_03785, partial [Candidatus Margulisbacteria bacterium]|nr:hypothetical protein [Candidatus Margulisiibacteriota bacterium]
SEAKNNQREIWEATVATFISKLVFALTFVIPVLLLELGQAMVVGVIWGMTVLGLLSYILAREEGESPWKVVGEHLLITLVVIIITHYLGELIAAAFG